MTTNMILGAVHKTRPQFGGVQCGHFAHNGGRGVLDADVRTFWCKNFGFFELYGVSAQTRRGGFEPARTLCGQGGCSIFRDCVRTPFMNGPLPSFAVKLTCQMTAHIFVVLYWESIYYPKPNFPGVGSSVLSCVHEKI